MIRLYAQLSTIVALLALTLSASAATITVSTLDDESNSDGDCSLREAIDAANRDVQVDGCLAGRNADQIVFAVALGGGTVKFSRGAVSVTDSLSINGVVGNAPPIRLDGDFLYTLLDVRSEMLTLRNIELINARGARGSAINVGANARLMAQNVRFARNEAIGNAATDGGGAVYVDGGVAILSACTFDTNRATGTSGSGGAVFNNGGTLTLQTSTFERNSANRAGGAIEANGGTTGLTSVDFSGNRAERNPGNGGAFHISGAGSATVRGGTVSRNVAGSEGGGFWNNTGSMRIAQTAFTDNTAGGDGADNGGGALFNNGGQMRLDTVTVNRNRATGEAGSGGGVFNDAGTVIVQSGTFTANTARRAGGAIEDANGTVTIAMATFSQNAVVENANPGNGGAVHSGSGTVVVSGGAFDGNRAVEGGGIWTSGDLTITASGAGDATTFTNNVATGNDPDQGGGALYATPDGVIVVSDADVTSNVASGTSGSGGGVFSAGSLTMSNSVVARNQANRAGGGIEDAGGSVDLEDVTLRANTIGTAAPGNGGGLHSGGGDVTVTGGLVEDNVAVEGGGLWVSGSLSINGGAGDIGPTGGDGDGNGDGTDDEGDDREDDDEDAISGDRSAFTIIQNNRATGSDAGIGGGGLFVETGGDASLRYVVLEGNAATGTSGSGGGLMIADGASARIAFAEIIENEANRAGGGIELFDDASTGASTSVALRNVTIDGNEIAAAMPGNGGGLHAGGAARVFVRQTTVSNNSAREGGGLWIAGDGALDLGNATVTRNAATESGGGVYDNGGAAITINSSTIALNSAGTTGGGLVSQGDSFSLRNTIIGTNRADGQGADCAGSFGSGGYNLIQSTSDCVLEGDTNTNVTGVDPMLSALANNGGFTRTHAPVQGGPAVDAGNSTFAFDQRGLQRGGLGSGAGQDIGAVELNGTPVSEEDAPTASADVALFPTHPNPVAARATISFTVAESGAARIEVYNVLGQRVLTPFAGNAVPGSVLEADLDVSTLAAGVYLVRLDSAGQTAVQQITVVR